MEKYDVKKIHKEIYSAGAREFTVVQVPEINFIAIDGRGDPNTSPDYAEAIEALYGVAYALKFESKKTLGRDMAVAPLEGLWRADDMAAFTAGDKSTWEWTMMISQPPWVTDDMVRAAISKVSAKKGLAALDRLRRMSLKEGKSLQILHVGSYDDEGPTLARLHDQYLPDHDLTFNGDHHEIYLNDPRRTDPARLRTILRQPVRAV